MNSDFPPIGPLEHKDTVHKGKENIKRQSTPKSTDNDLRLYKKTREELNKIEQNIQKLSESNTWDTDQLNELKIEKKSKLKTLKTLSKTSKIIEKTQLINNPIGVDPDILPQEAILFLQDQLKSKNAAQLCKYSRLPVVMTAIQGLKANYQVWEKYRLDASKLDALKINMEYQHYNLDLLCKVLDTFKDDKNLLNQIQFSPDFIDQYFKENPVDILNENIIKNLIQKEIDEIKLAMPSFKSEKEEEAVLRKLTKKLKDDRKESSITSKALEIQANLFNVERDGIAWTAQQDDLKDQNISVNLVYQIRRLGDPKGEVIAYHKQGSGGERATGRMEKLMWDIALIMEDEDRFAPTKESSIRSKANPSNPTQTSETAKTWAEKETKLQTKKGIVKEKTLELAEQAGLTKEKKGSIQIAQQGTRLDKYIDYPQLRKKPITQNELIKGTITTLVYGMYDAHAENIIVDDQGRLIFFDNTRGFPSSNGVIVYEGHLASSYRSGLLMLEGSFQKLDGKDRKQIQLEIDKYASRVKKLEEFLKNPLTVKRIQSLPPGWFNAKESLDALKERLAKLQSAIDNPIVENLRDFVFEANPDFKFFAAMQFLNEAVKSKGIVDINLQRKHFENVGYWAIPTLINQVSRLGIDAKRIRDLCESTNPSYSFEEIIDEMEGDISEYLALDRNTKLQTNTFNEKQALDVINDYYYKAKIDLKDVNRRDIPRYVRKTIIDQFKQNKIAVIDANLTKEPTFVDKLFKNNPTMEACVIDDVSGLKLCFKGDSGIETLDLDYMKEIGRIVANNQTYSVIELADILLGED